MAVFTLKIKVKSIDLTNSTLFENLIEIKGDSLYVDLHNDYNCDHIDLDATSDTLKISFSKIGSNSTVELLFQDIKIVKNTLLINKSFTKGITLDLFYRGRFEHNGNLFEYSEAGKSYFYIEFVENYCIELFTKAVQMIITD